MTRKKKSKSKWKLYAVLAFVSIIIIVGNQITKNIRADSERQKTLNELRDIESAMICYNLECLSYPTGSVDNILDSLEGNNTQSVQYLKLIDRKDEWGQNYLLKTSPDTSRQTFYSSGPNMIDDKCDADSDDIEYKEPIKMPNKIE